MWRNGSPPVHRIYPTTELTFHSKTLPTSFPGMSDSEKPAPPATEASDARPAIGEPRRRRGRRGGRGRRKSGPAIATPSPTDDTANAAVPGVAATELPSPAPEPPPVARRSHRPEERAPRPDQPHPASAISQAIDDVMDIVEALKRAMDQMEEVLELVEMAERQKLGDEREIESLRRALRQIHDRPRDSRGPRESRTPQRPQEPRGPREFREPRPEPESSDRAPASGEAESHDESGDD